MTDVAVIGASMTTFGQREAWIRELLAEAGSACLDDAGVAPQELEHLYVANMASGEFEGQTGVSNALASDLGAVPAYTQRDGRVLETRRARLREQFPNPRLAPSELGHRGADDGYVGHVRASRGTCLSVGDRRSGPSGSARYFWPP